MRSLTQFEWLKAVAEAENPSMLCSVGKDSSMMLRLTRKAFHPAPPPLPMLPVISSSDLVGLVGTRSERQGRAINRRQSASMEDKKQHWYL